MYNHNPSVSSITKTSCQCNIKDTFSGSWCIIAIGVQQWGNAGNSGGSVDVTFPISFTKTVYQIQLTYNNSSYENPTYEIKDTKSFSYWSKYGGDKLWLAIGVQQWGVDYGRANTKQINYPIAFAKFVKVVALDGFNSQRINCYSSLYEEPSLTYFKFNYDTETRFVNWIAVGY